MQYKSIAITGATGFQGGSIVRHLAATYPSLSIRAITRDIQKPAAVGLTSLGENISLLQADLEDKSSLVRAFAGVEAIYLVTDYWNVQNNPTAPNLNSEIMNGIAAIDAASEVPELKHFIFGSLLDFGPLSGMKFRNIYHFNTKTVLNAYIKSKPELWQKSTFVFTPIYFENFLCISTAILSSAWRAKVETPQGPRYTAFFPKGGVENLAFTRIEDLGKVVGAILEDPTRYYSKFAIMITEYYSATALLSMWSEVVGVEASVEQVDYSEWKKRAAELGAPEFMALEIWEQHRASHELGSDLRGLVDIETVDMREVVKLTTWKEWLVEQDWKPFFAALKSA